MIRLGHIGFNAILGYPFAILITKSYGLTQGLLFMFGLVVLASFPDGDEFFSNLTQDGGLSFLPFEISHRGITHTIYFSVIIGLLSGFIASLFVGHPTWMIIGLAGFFSITFHSFGDMFTPTGVNFIPPLTQNHTLDWFGYNNLFANSTLYFVGILAIGFLILIGLFDLGIGGIGIFSLIIVILSGISLRKGKVSDTRINF